MAVPCSSMGRDVTERDELRPNLASSSGHRMSMWPTRSAHKPTSRQHGHTAWSTVLVGQARTFFIQRVSGGSDVYCAHISCVNSREKDGSSLLFRLQRMILLSSCWSRVRK